MNKLWKFVLIGTAFGLAMSGSAQAKNNLRLSTVVNKPHPWIETAEFMASEVSKRTNGEVTIDIFPGGALGKDQTAIDEMRMGSIDFVLGSVQNAPPSSPNIRSSASATCSTTSIPSAR